MKFLNAIVDFLMGTNLIKDTNNDANVHYSPCNKIFGNLCNDANSKCLDYDYVSEDFVFTETEEVAL